MPDYTDYITQGAIARGLDPKIALHVVDTEGGRSGTTGDSGTSFGPFQMHVAGTAPGTSAPGLGNEMLAAGQDPKNPYQSIDYALDYAKQHGGFSPDIWHGLRNHPEGFYEGSLHVNVRPVQPDEDLGISDASAALLSSILASHYPTSDKSTGNSLLDSIMQSNVFGFAGGEEQKKPLDLKPLEQATPHATLPQMVAALQEPPVPQPLNQLSAPAIPPPAQTQQPTPQTVPHPPTEEFIEPPGKGQQVPAFPVAPQSAPRRPVIQPGPQINAASLIPTNLPETLKKTGNALLDHILSAPKHILGPHPAASLIGNMLTQGDERRGAAIPAEAFTAPGTAADQEQAQAEIPSGSDKIAEAIKQYVQDVVSGKKLASSDIFQNNYDPAKTFAQNAQNPAALGLAADIALGVTGGEGGRVEPPRLSEAPLRAIEGGKAEAPEAVPGATVGPPGPPPTEPPGGKMPPATPMPPPKGVKAETQALDDDLFRAAQSAEADRLEAQHLVDALPAELKGAADEQAYHERESRMTGKPIKPSSTTERIEKLLKPLDDKIHEDATWIREHADDIYKQLKEVDLKTAEQGYVHRKVAGQKIPGEMLDPERGDIISGLGGGLSRRASGLMHRTKDFVLEDNAGNRVPGRGPLVGQKGGPARYGETITDPRSGVKYTVKEPTTAELEAKYPQRKYVKSLLANTLDNYLRLSRVRRNVEILEKWKPQLQDAGHWMPENAQVDHPRNFVHVDVPQLRGWAEPHIASVLNDIYRVSRDDVVGMLQKVNKFLIGTMFSLPVRHQLNVAAHYAVGRGFDWVYRNPQLARAYTEVATQGPNYLRYLRAGAGLRYATTLNENFYNTLLSKLFHDQMTDPEWQGIFKELGHKAADVVKAEYAWSRRALWKVNDVFLTARIMELEKAGKPLAEAIKIAEDEIPNYRLPTNNLFTRKLISSPYIAFGRYGYGRASALAKTVMNLVGPNATGEERLRALGQALIMVVIGTEGYKIGNAALNGAQQQINQALGPKWGPRVAGAKPLTIGGIGPFGPTRATAQYIGSQLGLNDDEKGWASLLGSWISLAPAAELPAELAFNRNTFTGQPVVNENSSALGKMVQFGEATLGQLNPVQLAIDSARKGLLPGIGPQFGVQQEYKGPPGKIQRMLRRQAGRQEARDPIEQGIKSLLGR